MAFIEESSSVISFAEYSDVVARDQRLFDNNESLTDDVVEELLIRATDRIIANIRTTSWWQSYFRAQDGGSTSITSAADIPNPDPNKIQARQDDFTDLCVYSALADYILPMVADFSDADSAERQKMGYYKSRAEDLFVELVNAGNWYDFDGDNTVQQDERQVGYTRLQRIR